MHTTLNQIKAAYPCRSGWSTLLAALDKTEADDESLALTRILETNGIADAVWALRVCPAAISKIGEFAQRCADRAARYAADAYAAYAYAAYAARHAADAYAARYAADAADAARYAADAYAAADAARCAARYAAEAAYAADADAAEAEREKQKADFVELFS